MMEEIPTNPNNIIRAEEFLKDMLEDDEEKQQEGDLNLRDYLPKGSISNHSFGGGNSFGGRTSLSDSFSNSFNGHNSFTCAPPMARRQSSSGSVLQSLWSMSKSPFSNGVDQSVNLMDTRSSYENTPRGEGRLIGMTRQASMEDVYLDEPSRRGLRSRGGVNAPFNEFSPKRQRKRASVFLVLMGLLFVSAGVYSTATFVLARNNQQKENEKAEDMAASDSNITIVEDEGEVVVPGVGGEEPAEDTTPVDLEPSEPQDTTPLDEAEEEPTDETEEPPNDETEDAMPTEDAADNEELDTTTPTDETESPNDDQLAEDTTEDTDDTIEEHIEDVDAEIEDDLKEELDALQDEYQTVRDEENAATTEIEQDIDEKQLFVLDELEKTVSEEVQVMEQEKEAVNSEDEALLEQEQDNLNQQEDALAQESNLVDLEDTAETPAFLKELKQEEKQLEDAEDQLEEEQQEILRQEAQVEGWDYDEVKKEAAQEEEVEEEQLSVERPEEKEDSDNEQDGE